MKKLCIVCLVAVMLMTATITAFAETGYFDFYFSPGDTDYSGLAIKADSEQRAYVTITDSDFISSDKTWFRVRDAADNIATETKWANSNISFTLNYQVRGVAGAYYQLKGQQDSSCLYSVNVSGRWTP